MKKLFPVICLFSFSIAAHSFAGSATWNLNPSSNEWNTATNWTPATVPDGPSDVATFAVSNETNLFFRESVELDQMVFDPGASPYTMTCNPRVDFDLMGAGIVNNSGVNQTFVTRALQNQTGIGNIELVAQFQSTTASVGRLGTASFLGLYRIRSRPGRQGRLRQALHRSL
jgi:hypothetical protein